MLNQMQVADVRIPGHRKSRTNARGIADPAFECRLLRIEVCDLQEGTFFARLVLERDWERMRMDCRPSDAIALSVRLDAPIFVADEVLDEVCP